MSGLTQEKVRLVSTFDAQAVVNVAKAFNNAVDMSEETEVSFVLAADSSYIDTDADLTLQVYEVAANVVTGGVALSGKTITIAGDASAAKKQGIVDVLDTEMTDGMRYLYAEIVAAGATQTAVVSGVALSTKGRYGLGNTNAVTGTTYAV
jgi:hypothetical protein